MAGSDFGKAFSAARASGLAVFDFQGKKYHTKTKEEMEAAVKAVKPTEAPKTPSYEAPNTEENAPTAAATPAGNAQRMGKTLRVALEGMAPSGQPATRATGANDGAAANVSTAGPSGPRSGASRMVVADTTPQESLAKRMGKGLRGLSLGSLARRDERGYNK